jgi:type II secretory pathway component PulM
MFEKLKVYSSRLHLPSHRKDRMVVYFGGFLVCLLVYVLFTAGFEYIDQAQLSLNDKRDLYTWMKINAPLVQKIRTQRNTLPDLGQNSLGAVENSLKAKQLESYVQKSEQLQDQKIQISFKQIPFDSLIKWLAELRQSINLQVSVLSVQGSDQQGIIDAELVLGLPGAKSRESS